MNKVVHTPMANAPPKSLSATHGHGSLEWSILRFCSQYYSRIEEDVYVKMQINLRWAARI